MRFTRIAGLRTWMAVATTVTSVVVALGACSSGDRGTGTALPNGSEIGNTSTVVAPPPGGINKELDDVLTGIDAGDWAAVEDQVAVLQDEDLGSEAEESEEAIEASLDAAAALALANLVLEGERACDELPSPSFAGQELVSGFEEVARSADETIEAAEAACEA